jgi:hypothetical protein
MTSLKLIVAESKMSTTYKFFVYFPGEVAAGLYPFDDDVSVTLDSGNPGGEDGEFEEYMRQCLADWYDTKVIYKGKE